MPKRLSPVRLKRHYSYTFEEAARVIGGSVSTLRAWARSGDLYVICDKRPYLIRGADLIECIKARYARKPLTSPTEFFCLGCKAPRTPAFGEVELVRRFPRGGGLLRGLCVHCGCLIHKQTSPIQLSQIASLLNVTNNIDL